MTDAATETEGAHTESERA